MPDIDGPDDLSEWEPAPPLARARGAPELIRSFDSAEAALAFLAGQAERSHKAALLRPARRLAAVGVAQNHRSALRLTDSPLTNT